MKADVAPVCEPKGVGAKKKPMYEQASVKAISEGEEKHELGRLHLHPP